MSTTEARDRLLAEDEWYAVADREPEARDRIRAGIRAGARRAWGQMELRVGDDVLALGGGFQLFMDPGDMTRYTLFGVLDGPWLWLAYFEKGAYQFDLSNGPQAFHPGYVAGKMNVGDYTARVLADFLSCLSALWLEAEPLGTVTRTRTLG